MIIPLSRKGFEADSLKTSRDSTHAARGSQRRDADADVQHGGRAAVRRLLGQLAVIQAVLDIGSLWLAILAVALSVVGAYYLRVVKLMYFDEPTDKAALQGGGGRCASCSA
ncbi:MAG: hypothetical protein IPF84_16305 [Proteobacteria bacterium]|nr:hypothetical protein [Pseudomonadota bacterium]